jgi:hypothetical protein
LNIDIDHIGDRQMTHILKKPAAALGAVLIALGTLVPVATVAPTQFDSASGTVAPVLA